MSSRASVSNQFEDSWSPAVSVSGAAVWAAFATLAGLRRAPFGIIELLFLLAPLVVVPLGLELARVLASPAPGFRNRRLRYFQILSTVGISVAFWLRPGPIAAILSAFWLLHCVFLAGCTVMDFRRRQSSLLSFLLILASVDLLIGAAWLLVSRVGWRPMSFQEPIILLTAIHFHYSGFATALIAAASLHAFERNGLRTRGLKVLVLLVVIVPFAVAAGFVVSPALRLSAALALETSVTVLAGILFWFAGRLRNVSACIYLRMASCAAVAALALAALYAFSEYSRKDWVSVPDMANSHGVLNGVGFVLLATLAWLMELDAPDAGIDDREWSGGEKTRTLRPGGGKNVRMPETDGNGRLTPLPSPSPEFVARDFYDR